MRLLLTSLLCLLAANQATAQPPDIAAIIKQLSAPEVKDRSSAISALHRLGPQAKAAVPALVNLCRSDVSRSLRDQALATFGAIGPGATAAIPLLVDVAKGGQEPIGSSVSTKVFLPADTIQPLHANHDLRCEAVRSLGKVGGYREVPLLLTLIGMAKDGLKKQSPTERRVIVGRQRMAAEYYVACVEALGNIGARHQGVPGLKEALQAARNLSETDQYERRIRTAADTALRKLQAAQKQ